MAAAAYGNHPSFLLCAIVQSVPDFHFNTLLGQVFEARVGSGSLLVCGYDLTRHVLAHALATADRSSAA
jgi:hypothetical protein